MEKEILYRKGTRVWLPDPEHVWVGGTLQEDYNEKQLTVELEDGTVVDVDLAKGKQLPPLRNPEILVGANDLTSLSYLHEPAVLHNLRERFLTQNEIYTYCGIVLVALNPYADIQIYGPEMATAYSGVSIGEMDPHIFAVAEDAFRSMVDDGKNQSIIVSGESGAGKTVSAKYTMRYFAYVGGSTTETAIEHKVLASNPILEAIGNAKTIRNDNSSRFGKYIEINFDENNHISGAHMRTYLLEKSRVIYQAPNERNYHIFYQLCSSRGLQELQELNLKDPNEFYYTQQGEAPIISGVDDEQCFQETSEAMAVLGIYSEQQRMIWRILAAILHLGNINIISTSKSGESCHVKVDDFHAVMVSSLLGVNLNQLCKWLCARKIIATGDVYVKPLTYKESNNGRDALAKYIYSQLFDWIVEHVNSNLAVTTVRKSFIGVLDIYGFETFDVNSFEQFCINYANEKLQQQFNQHVFKLEQEEYIKEQITWSFIDFYDNQPCLDLIEMKIGILDLLDEECRMPKGSDESWARKMYKEHIQKSKHFVKPRLSDKAFIVRHYADDVIYDCNGFVEKNRDSINEEHLQLLKASEYELVGELFNSQENTSAFVPRKRTSSRVGKHAPKGKKTVGSQFRDSLRSLMDALNSTSPHYVRCIKSNDEKSSFELDMKRCVQQLRACGVLETIRISAAGYPSRWTYKEFFDRYRMLISWKQINWDSLHGTCQTILTSLIHDDDKFQFGKTKIFFRAGQVAYLERLRSDKLRESCITIQKNIKSWLVYRHYRKLKKSTITIQCWVRSYQARRYVQFLRETKAATKIQSCWRRFVCYKSYQETYTFIIFVQAHIRGLLVRQRLTAFIREKKSIVIQKSWRGYTARREYKKIRRAVILAQCCVRRRAAKKEFKRLKIEARSVEHLKSLTKGMELKVIALQQKLTDEQNERKSLQQQLSTVTTMEDEILKLKELRPLYNELLKVNKELQANNEGLTTNNNKLIEENNALKEKLEITNKEKDEELKTTKSSLVLLRETVTNQKQKLEMVEAEDEATLTQKLKEQKEQLLLEFNSERASHQKMIGEYARLEQRFMNLQEELKIEKASPDKRRRKSTLNAQAVEDLIVEDENPEGRISSITADLFDVTRERDQLLEQVELLKEEHNISLNLSKNTEQPTANSSTEIMKANQTLKEEKDSLEKELNILRQAIVDGEEKSLDKQDRVMSKLLEQIKELRKENAYLKKQLEKQSVDEKIPVPSNYNNNGNINDVAEKEISRVTLENITLKEENEHIRAQLKDALSRSITSPPKRTNSFTKKLEKGLGPRSKSNVSELYRNRTPSGIDQNNLSDSGRLFMTYAGLMRKRPGSFGKLNSPNGNVMPSKLGMLKFTAENQEEIINKLILSMDSNHVEKEVPGLPAHIIFMGVRYIDYINDERLMQSFLTAAITAIKKCVTKTAGDIDTQAFWLSNSFRLCCDMKQYSGDQQYQSMNTREQNMQCLVNFDLSEYRQVLADACIKIYQDMVSTIQKRINNLIVPGMLEYESIPGIISTTKRFKSERKASEEIITVKDITNKLSAILAVLNAHCVETGLIKQIFRQIYYFINSTMMNNILLRKDMCHWSRGLQIKFNLTQLEEWCRTNQLHENYNVVEQLAPITEVVQLLQVNKKSLSDLEAILNTVTKLNALQVQKILSMYTPPNEYEPRVPANLIRAVVGRMKKEEAMFLMMDLNYISPMTTPFVPSTVNFNEVTIPEPLGMKSFEII